MRFLTIYKCAYLAACILNLVILAATSRNVRGDLEYLGPLSAIVLTANVVAWFGYRTGQHWGRRLEEVLSVGRLMMIAFASTFFLLDLVMMSSPVGVVLWEFVMLPAFTTHHLLFWAGCAILLALETMYFRRIRRLPDGVSPYREAASA